ncbi:lanC-like protein 2 isoform X1 [Neodiprion pinetum]|uniref:LanC-like protein 2 isoform X1 n=2 Tax=Neodiprion lecontei TaxID=441921 RepID=A0ABM3G5A6_NEOLC|nr:lanC-like protein 2 isoform X1 [Neodiprion pinetum]XP_046595455.1 lanC-like protein 2 isoform X1 [Neodiprion lecontei]
MMSNPSAATSESSRYYENTFREDYELEKNLIVDQDKDTICDDFKETLSASVKSLMRELERNKNYFENSTDFSIYTGTTGIANLYYHYGTNFNDPSYISRANETIERSLSRLKTSKRLITFLCGSAGPLALGAVINHLHFAKDKSRSMIADLAELSKHVIGKNSDCPDELLYGRAGYLYALLFVNNRITPPPFEASLIKQVIGCILNSGQVTAKAVRSEFPLLYSWHDKLYLGGAHGLAGILFLLLQAVPYLTEYQLKEQIEPAIHYLMKMRFVSGNFPSSVGNQSDKLVQWCHGAPSMTMLFHQAYKVFGKPEYLQVALGCGDVVWSRGLLKKGYGICHGVAGNAYTFLYLYQATKEIKHLYRACKFAEWCMNYGKHQNRTPDRPFSLFEGLAGTIYFLIDVQQPLFANFPAYAV